MNVTKADIERIRSRWENHKFCNYENCTVAQYIWKKVVCDIDDENLCDCTDEEKETIEHIGFDQDHIFDMKEQIKTLLKYIDQIENNDTI